MKIKILVVAALALVASMLAPTKAFAWTDHGWHASVGGSLHCYSNANNFVCDAHPYAGGVHYSVVNLWLPSYCSLDSVAGAGGGIVNINLRPTSLPNGRCIANLHPHATKAYRDAVSWPYNTSGYASYWQSSYVWVNHTTWVPAGAGGNFSVRYQAVVY